MAFSQNKGIEAIHNVSKLVRVVTREDRGSVAALFDVVSLAHILANGFECHGVRHIITMQGGLYAIVQFEEIPSPPGQTNDSASITATTRCLE